MTDRSRRPRGMRAHASLPPRRARWIAGGVLCLALGLPPAAWAETFSVDIGGAGGQRDLLNAHLDIVRQSGTDLPPEQIERLVASAPEQIRELLATEGYFSPAIRWTLDKSASPWVVRFEVDAGTPARIVSATIGFEGGIAEGATADEARMERLRRSWGLERNAIFRQAAWSESKSALLKDLLTRDYPAASIAFSEARVDPRDNGVALRVEVDSGPPFTFGDLDIHGLKRYSRALIDNLNPIHPGDPYSQDKLNELQARLEDSGYFRSAFATVDVDPARPQAVPVRLDLTENPRKRLALGGGFSTDTGARIQARWLDRNFLSRDWRLESELRVDRETHLLGGDIYLPPAEGNWLPPGWLPSVGARLERTTSGGETDDKLRMGLRIASPNRFDEKAWALNYLGDRQRVGDSFVNNRQALVLSFIYTRRRLDHPLRPQRGYVASVEVGGGPRGLINESTLLRLVTRATLIRPLAPQWHAVLRGLAGQVFGGSRLTVPADLLFRAGGDQSVRGYGYNSLGVLQNGAVVGGTVTAVVSAELVRQLTPNWGAAVFMDAGNAADAWRDFRMERGSGVGARWTSPIGPVSIDLAYGHATHKPRLHFSVGYGF